MHGLEQAINEYNPKLGVIRYADDFVVTAKDKESLEEVRIQIEEWMSERNLVLSFEKLHLKEGYDFLGFNMRHYNGKLITKPQKEKVLALCKPIGAIIKDLRAKNQQDVIVGLNQVLRGFANYYRGVVSKEVFSYINSSTWHYLWRWAKRRHPSKSKKWVKNKYFRKIGDRDWIFAGFGTGRGGKEKNFELYDISSTPIVRHVKVKGSNSPDDPARPDYWQNRNTKTGKKHWAKGSKYEQVAIAQNWVCPVCAGGLYKVEEIAPLRGGTEGGKRNVIRTHLRLSADRSGTPLAVATQSEIETHHIVPVAEGGRDDSGNLMHLHKACHKQVHSKSKVKSWNVRRADDVRMSCPVLRGGERSDSRLRKQPR